MIDQWIPAEDEQVTVDPRTQSRTIHTGLTYPDGSQGFIIIGRIGNEMWEPLKTIKKVLIEYVEEPVVAIEIDDTAFRNRVQNGGDKSGSVGDGKQTNGVGQRSRLSNRKRSIRPKKGR